MPNLGGWELIVLLGVLVLLFGATKLPAAARAIGQSMRILKAETKGMRSEDEANPPASPQQAPQQVLPPSGPTATPVGEPAAVQEPTAVQKSQRNNDTTR
ncbi:MAG: Sec-independent protein translocase subunit TatA [Actinomycetota bacterium]|jgi:sec-independent protein translocase protein TatA|nr:Sec-independent protein translocase subunit TatA [Actinomycetota bacterium]